MRKSSTHGPLDSLKSACTRSPDKVIVLRQPALDIEKIRTGVRGVDEIKRIIVSDEMENISSKGYSKPLENWNGDPPAPIVHHYKFTFNHGETWYIAFYKTKVGWVVKSFHPSR